MKFLSVFLIAVGCFVFSAGMYMRAKQKPVIRYGTEVKEGNMGVAVGTGAAVGGAVGAGLGAAVGGVGIAACGTGVGIPVGVVCLAAAGVLGLFGAGVGAAAGTSDEVVKTQVTEMVAAHTPVEYWSVIVFGVFLAIVGIFLLLRLIKQRKEEQCWARLIDRG